MANHQRILNVHKKNADRGQRYCRYVYTTTSANPKGMVSVMQMMLREKCHVLKVIRMIVLGQA